MQKFGRRYAETAAQRHDRFQQRLALAALEQADLGAMQSARLRELLLRQAALGANPSQNRAELVSLLHAVTVADPTRLVKIIGRTPITAIVRGSATIARSLDAF